jgi:stress-induced morphogen
MKKVRLEKKQDKATRLIYERLKERFPNLPDDIEKVVYRYWGTLIKVRVVDSSFARKTYLEREALIEDILDSLPKEVHSSISVLMLLTPKEAKDKSDVMNHEFDHPETLSLK